MAKTPTSNKIDPTIAQAMQLHRASRRVEAETLYRRAVGSDPNDWRRHYLLGLCRLEMGRLEEGVSAMQDAVRLAPNDAGARYALGRGQAALGRGQAARETLQEAIRLAPRMAEAYLELGNLLAGGDAFDEAIATYRRGLAQTPSHPGLSTNLATTLYRSGARAEAVKLWSAAAAADPPVAAALNGLALDKRAQGDVPACETLLRRAIALEPANAEFRFNLAVTLRMASLYGPAIAELEAALRLAPKDRAAAVELAVCRKHVCDWAGFAQLMPAIEREIDLVAGGARTHLPAFAALALPIPFERRAVVPRRRSREVAEAVARSGGPLPTRAPLDRARLRLGYLSSDFRDHAIGQTVVGIFGFHDRARFEVFGYSFGRDDSSAYRQRIAADIEHFVELRDSTPAEMARRIRADEIDILVDLNGLTGLSRPETLAWRPAPIQASWWGYAGPLGASYIDYALVDPVVAPAETRALFAEKLCYLPHCYMPNDRWPPTTAATPSRAEAGLPQSGVVFCSFCAAYKIEPEIFALWLSILKQVPGSVLWLFDELPEATRNLKAAAAAAGLEEGRLVFGPRMPKPAHLARLKLADLMLDTLTYGGHTTLSDALSVGLPAISKIGDSFPSRVGASCLRAVGLSELVVDRLADYEALAVRLGRDPAALAALRARLASLLPTAPFFDMARLVKNLERGFDRIWRLYRAGEAPRDIAIVESEGG